MSININFLLNLRVFPLKFQKQVIDLDSIEDISKMSPIEITQELRGSLYYFIESLVPQMQSSQNYNEKNTIKIITFFSLCVKMFASFLNRFSNLQKEVKTLYFYIIFIFFI